MRTRCTAVGAALAALTTGVALLPSASASAATVPGTTVTYTTNADFEKGALQAVNHNAPNTDQLQLNRTQTFFPTSM